MAISTMICQSVYHSTNFTWFNFSSTLIYGLCVVFMYTMSTAYHCVQYLPVKKWLKLFDHIAIYFAIAGMTTPLCAMLMDMGGNDHILGLSILITQWVAVLGGIIFKFFTVGRYKGISTSLYLMLGWTCAIPIVRVFPNLNDIEIFYFFGSGILYTIGTIFYSIRSIEYFHPIWHVFVLIATTFHNLFMLNLLTR